IPDQTINEGIQLAISNTATDVDGAVQTLNYILVNPPAGATIDTNGVITWVPSEAQGPGNYAITTIVSDNGVPSLSATNSFKVTVLEVNSRPVLPAQSTRTVGELSLLTVTNTATDSDIPANILSYQLTSAPSGATIDSVGVIRWIPTEAQGPG